MSKSNSATILVTGATGNIGKELTQQLVAQKVPFRAMVRADKDAEALNALDGVEAVIGDFDDAASIAEALKGVERAFLLTNSSEQAEEQQLRFVDAATSAGVKHIVKLSQWAADHDSPVRFLRYHAVVEQKIRESGMDYTFLRPNLFMQGLLSMREPIVTQRKFFAPIGDAKISVVDVRDIAAVAAAALTGEGHKGKVYNLTGSEALTHQEIAEKLSHALNREITFVDIPPEAMRETLASVGFPAWQADGLIEDYAHYKRGEAASVETGVQDATGKPPHSFEDFAREYAPEFA